MLIDAAYRRWEGWAHVGDKRGVENSSHMGFIFSSLHKHDLISVVKYSSSL